MLIKRCNLMNVLTSQNVRLEVSLQSSEYSKNELSKSVWSGYAQPEILPNLPSFGV